MAIRVNRYQVTSAFQGETDAAPRRRGARGTAQAQGFTLQIEQLVGLDLTADGVDGGQ